MTPGRSNTPPLDSNSLRNMQTLLRGQGLLAVAFVLSACGGGGGGSAGPDGPTPALRYADHRIEAAFGVPLAPIVPIVTGVAPGATYSVQPALPLGLSLDPATGVLAGTPLGASAAASYEVRAGATTATVELRVSAPSRFFYTASATDGTLLVQGIEGESGAPLAVGLLPKPTGLAPITDAAVCTSSPLLVAAHGQAGQAGVLVVYDADPATGALTERGRAPLGNGPHRVVVAPDGGAAYVTDFGDDVVRAFALTPGNPPQALGAPRATGDGPESLALVIDGVDPHTLVVANRAAMSLSSYRVDPLTAGITTATSAFVLNGGVPSSIAALDDESVVVTLENFALAITARVMPSLGTLTAVFGGVQTGQQPNGVAVHPSGELVLVANTVEGSVSVLARATSGLPLVARALVLVQAGPTRIRFDAAGRFAYVAAAATGELTVLGIDHDDPRVAIATRSRLRAGVASLGLLEGLGPFERALGSLYVIDESDNTLAVFSPQGGPGNTLTSPMPAVSTGSRPLGAAVSQDGRWVLVVAQAANSVDAYPLDSAGLPGLPVQSATAGSPSDIAIAPGGRVAVVASQSPPLLTSYTFDSFGSLTQLDFMALPSPPGHVVIDPVGRTVVATAVTAGQLVSVRLDAEGQFVGAAQAVAASGVPRSLAFTIDGRFVLTALETQDRLAAYAVGVDGRLTQVPPAGVDGSSTGDRPNGVAVHPRGAHVLAAVFTGAGTFPGIGTGAVDVLGIDPATGALSRQSSLVVGLGPVEVIFEPTGRYAYALNRMGQDLSILRFDPIAGTLTALGAVTLGNRPARVLARSVIQ